MAVYGRSFYGLATYGADVATRFDVSPFTAKASGYGAIRASWRSPAGAWQSLRLLRSKQGYAVDENDGHILVDSATPADHFVDTDLPGGMWFYYTIFIQDDSGTWNKAGTASGMSVKKPWTKQSHDLLNPQLSAENYVSTLPVPYGFGDLLWDRIPEYFRYVRRTNGALTDEYYVDPNQTAHLYRSGPYDQENQHLRSFVNVLGWGLDMLYGYQENILDANDPTKTHVDNLALLANQFGFDLEQGVPVAVMRSKVNDAALLARRRGTLSGLRDAVIESTGWDVDLQVDHNDFLNRDQSEFANPVFPEWDPGVNYATGQKVQYEGRIFTAQTGAYGQGQKPPPTGTSSNTWWTETTDTDDDTLTNPDTNAVVTWKGWQDGTAEQTLSVAIGISSPFDDTSQESNALAIRNNDSVAHTYDVVGASNLAGDGTVLPKPQYAILQGLPIPQVVLWDSAREYEIGDFVQHYGTTWRSLGPSLNEPPSADSVFWEKVGIDERPLLAYSFYGLAKTTGVPVTPGMAFFDEQGSLIEDDTTVTVESDFFFDTFNNDPNKAWVDRTPDFGFGTGATWNADTGEWSIGGYGSEDERVAYPLSSTGTTTVVVPAALTQYDVSVTFYKAPPAGKTDALVFRYVDANNYLRVTRTKVQKMDAGTLSDLVTIATPITDGDRVTLVLDDSANTWTLQVNGTQAASGSSALTAATSPYSVGLMVV